MMHCCGMPRNRAISQPSSERWAKARMCTLFLESNNWTLLHRACYYGHLEIIRALLDAGANPEAKAKDEATPLHWACLQGNVEAARILLLEAGANIHAQDRVGWTALHYAAAKGHLDVVKVLVGRWCMKIDAVDNNGKTPLSIACYWGELEVCQRIAQAGSRPFTERQQKRNRFRPC